ncbi:hypothetical protein TPR58_07140 [Sphingomonas sp. HF-S3]|uniref:Intradiol ring-cleavage dioxygenases domain-containing protein n=1 Tax=Sphingomonas rustica TaxID=3103142 RepID=A0ABV0B8M5_9SPHN
MQEPSLRTSRLAIASGLAAAIVLGGGGFLLGRAASDPPKNAHVPMPAPGPTMSPSPAPAAPAVLGRADLIDLARLASDPGEQATAQLARATGRRFEIRLPFGCDGPDAEASAAPMRWQFDAERSTLRIQAAPVTWTMADWRDEAGPQDDAVVEGFWISRAWTASDACPVAAARATDGRTGAASGETLALGQVFVGDGPRRARRDGQPYRITQRISEGQMDGSQGFHLRLTGRIAALPGAPAPVHCHQPGGPDQRPICLVGTVFDQVAIENAATGQVIATWDGVPGDASIRDGPTAGTRPAPPDPGR